MAGPRIIKLAGIALSTGIVMLILVAGSVQASTPPKLLTQQAHDPFRVRPAMIGYTGDGTGFVGKSPIDKHRGFLHWKSWRATTAYGTATIWLNDCTPSCAGGTFHSYRGSVRASRVRHGDFTRMTLRFRYNGRSVTDERKLLRAGSTYFWGIVKQTGF